MNALLNTANSRLRRSKPLPTLAALRFDPQSAYKNAHQVFFKFLHNGFAMLGAAIFLICLVLMFKPDLLKTGEAKLIDWLQARQTMLDLDDYKGQASVIPSGLTVNLPESALDASERATATDPADLPKQQAAVAFWISKKYKVAPEPVAALVEEAYKLGSKVKLDPTLILAIMAIESGFNPFAQSPVGAQGLMQVMTKIHSDKYENFGGKLAAFDPVTNLRVGVKVLQESIARAGGSIEGGLKQYVGAANLPHDDGYGSKVLSEYNALHRVATGRPAPIIASSAVPAAISVDVSNIKDQTESIRTKASGDNQNLANKGELLAKL
ncbi:MAG TPA: lytic transglycosylase domain-containing protein [Burkholderiaceae bacterium]|nr:lytic transglycosylase domain-containing protein [Burkholderiaceae bacterium]